MTKFLSPTAIFREMVAAPSCQSGGSPFHLLPVPPPALLGGNRRGVTDDASPSSKIPNATPQSSPASASADGWRQDLCLGELLRRSPTSSTRRSSVGTERQRSGEQEMDRPSPKVLQYKKISVTPYHGTANGVIYKGDSHCTRYSVVYNRGYTWATDPPCTRYSVVCCDLVTTLRPGTCYLKRPKNSRQK